jgi:hypothetical protein
MILPTYFEKFVSSVQPTEERVAAVSDAHNTLRDHLTNDAKPAHPVADSFLSGSYARKTAIDPIKDADIILILEESKVSADRREPNPRKVLDDLRSAIDEFYEDVNLETQRRSIQVWLEEEDVRMDVVPAIAPNGKDEKLWVPDYHQQKWIESWPKAHITHSREANDRSDGHFVRLVKALKWWRELKLDKERAPKSFLLEVMASKYLTSKDTLPETFLATIRTMHDDFSTCVKEGTLPNVVDPGVGCDLVDSCQWTYADLVYVDGHLATLSQTAQEAIDAADKVTTVEKWQAAFGDKYPSSLSEEEDRSIAKSLAEHQEIRSLVPMRFAVSVTATVRPQNNAHAQLTPYLSGSYKLPKNYHIRFEAQTNVPQPYTVRWTVMNHGVEARRSHDLRRQYEYGPDSESQRVRWEHTGYRGHHYMLCEIIRDGSVLATTRFKVNVR